MTRTNANTWSDDNWPTTTPNWCPPNYTDIFDSTICNWPQVQVGLDLGQYTSVTTGASVYGEQALMWHDSYGVWDISNIFTGRPDGNGNQLTDAIADNTVCLDNFECKHGSIDAVVDCGTGEIPYKWLDDTFITPPIDLYNQ